MAPFIGNPPDISSDALKLLDRALGSIWNDELSKRALARSRDGQSGKTPGKPAGAAERLPRAPPVKL